MRIANQSAAPACLAPFGMLILSYRQLRLEPVRTAMTIIVVAAVIAEILVLEGFLAGLYSQLRDAVLNRGGDLIVTQAGISNFVATRSVLPQTARLDIEAIEGVRVAHPLTGLSVIYFHGGRRTPIVILVYDTSGGPTRIIEGHDGGVDRGIVIDQALAVKYDLSPGDAMIIADFEFIVSGISTNSAAFLTPFAFISYDDLIDFYLESDVAADIATFPLLSFLLVSIEPGANSRDVAARIEDRVEAADVFLPAELAVNDENLGRAMIGPILNLLLAVSYGIGALVVGMFMFTAVRGRLRNYGVLKALGFRTRSLVYIVLAEAAIVSLLALPLGVLFADAISVAIHSFAPVYLILIAEPGAVARTAVAALGFAAFGTLIPLRAIARFDPAVVFRS